MGTRNQCMNRRQFLRSANEIQVARKDKQTPCEQKVHSFRRNMFILNRSLSQSYLLNLDTASLVKTSEQIIPNWIRPGHVSLQEPGLAWKNSPCI